jgi:hypothetical protein
MSKGQLLAVHPDGRHKLIDNTYESIRDAMDGAIIDLVGLPNGAGFFVDDEGMLNQLAMNVPASMFCGLCLYGPVVLCGEPDEEGETQPPPSNMLNGFTAMASMWRSVVFDAIRKGQEIICPANPETLPPATIVEMTDAMFDEYLRTGEVPQ